MMNFDHVSFLLDVISPGVAFVIYVSIVDLNFSKSSAANWRAVMRTRLSLMFHWMLSSCNVSGGYTGVRW